MTTWRRAGPLALLLALAGISPCGAESWGGIVPGETSRRALEAVYGRPSRERSVVEEGRTVAEWTYAGDRAPRGLDRMVVSFGMLGSAGFSADVVRSVAIYPRPRVFNVSAIATGWGTPDAVGTEEQSGRPALRFDRLGLFIVMDRNGEYAEMLLFAPTPRAPAR